MPVEPEYIVWIVDDEGINLLIVNSEFNDIKQVVKYRFPLGSAENVWGDEISPPMTDPLPSKGLIYLSIWFAFVFAIYKLPLESNIHEEGLNKLALIPRDDTRYPPFFWKL